MWPLLARCVQMGSLTLLPGPPGLPISWARLEIGPCSMIVRILIRRQSDSLAPAWVVILAGWVGGWQPVGRHACRVPQRLL